MVGPDSALPASFPPLSTCRLRTAGNGREPLGGIGRLLAFLANSGLRARDPWPERDLAFIATDLLTGCRLAELLSLDLGSLDGRAGERRLKAIGKGNKERFLPIEEPLERILDRYLETRRDRFPKERHSPTALFVRYRREYVRDVSRRHRPEAREHQRSAAHPPRRAVPRQVGTPAILRGATRGHHGATWLGAVMSCRACLRRGRCDGPHCAFNNPAFWDTPTARPEASGGQHLRAVDGAPGALPTLRETSGCETERRLTPCGGVRAWVNRSCT